MYVAALFLFFAIIGLCVIELSGLLEHVVIDVAGNDPWDAGKLIVVLFFNMSLITPSSIVLPPRPQQQLACVSWSIGG